MEGGTDQKKYDRQLRLWGEAAQARIEATKVMSIGSDAVATEFMKSVILPGMGAVSIADSHIVDDDDLETNFFIEVSDKGKKRGQRALENLLELNDRVSGEFHDMDIVSVLNDASLLQAYDIFVCTNQLHQHVVSLSKRTTKPVFEVAVNGYVGMVKVYVQSHVIFDDGNVDIPMDLRVLSPFPELQKLYSSIDITKLSKDDHQHLPFPLILIWALEEWRRQTNNPSGHPRTRQEKADLKEIIKKQAFNFYLEENFGEAYQYAFYCWQETPISVKRLLGDVRCQSSLRVMTKEQAEFWAFIGAVKQFNDAHGRLPVDSGIKDMISSNEMFLALQNAYNTQLDEDAAEILALVNKRLHNDEMDHAVTLTIDTVKMHCKALRKMHVIDGVDGEANQTWEGEAFQLDEPGSCLMYLAVFYASLAFQDKYGRAPVGDADKAELQALTGEVLRAKGASHPVDDFCIDQFVRYGGVQLHTVSAVIGSFVGQEVIKYASHKFGALDNTFLFNTETCLSLHGRY